MSAWRSELVAFLERLQIVQNEIMTMADKKRQLFGNNDMIAVANMESDEQLGIVQMRECLAKREKLLQYAAAEGLPSESVETLAKEVVPKSDDEFYRLLRSVQFQTRLLQQHNLTNWVIAQRSVLHVSQILEIIATRGLKKSTYTRKHGKNIGASGGSIVDKNA
ncbi:MAG: flagellar protein FlgN [Planctomycetaceae bacterium]|nr:flagellar protein FlgN [Planctomycetaceae bacterium]